MTREKAIKIVKEFINSTCLHLVDQEALETLIPELAESEDERIRQALIEGVRQIRCKNGITQEQMLAWLEKQKKHQENCTKFLAKILKHSAEGFRNVLKKKGIDYIPHEAFWTNTAGTFSKQECNEFYKWMDDMTMELVTEETPEYKKGFKDGLNASKKEQEPLKVGENAYFDPNTERWFIKKEQEPIRWTDLTWKDIVELEGIINNVHYDFSAGIGQESFGKEVLERFRSTKGIEYLDEAEQKCWREEEQKEQKPTLVEKLRSISTPADENWFEIQKRWEKEDEQQPAEWNEEDTEMYINVASSLRGYACGLENEEHKGHIKKELDWLENRFKYFRPQSKDEIYKEKNEAFKLGKHQLAIKFMNYLDENRPKDKMSLSNSECEDIDKAFKENDLAKIIRYAEKYLSHWKFSEEDEKDMAHIIRILDDCYAYGRHDLSKTDHDNLTSMIKALCPSWKFTEEQEEPEYYQHFDPDC